MFLRNRLQDVDVSVRYNDVWVIMNYKSRIIGDEFVEPSAHRIAGLSVSTMDIARRTQILYLLVQLSKLCH
jgi:hypothetical protein